MPKDPFCQIRAHIFSHLIGLNDIQTISITLLEILKLKRSENKCISLIDDKCSDVLKTLKRVPLLSV